MITYNKTFGLTKEQKKENGIHVLGINSMAQVLWMGSAIIKTDPVYI